MENKTRNSWWSLIIILPLLWGFFGLIQGKGFFPYIIENIKALTIPFSQSPDAGTYLTLSPILTCCILFEKNSFYHIRRLKTPYFRGFFIFLTRAYCSKVIFPLANRDVA